MKLAPTLIKSLAIGATAAAAFVGTTIIAPSAQASVLISDATAPGFEFIIGDKKFYNFASTGDVQADDTLDFSNVGNTYAVQYNPGAGATVGLQGTGTLSYNVDILDPNRFFKQVELNSDGVNPFTVTKETAGLTLTNINGVPDVALFPLGLQTISVVDTFTANGAPDSLLFSVSNKFTQTSGAIIESVPEPSSVLGLLAIGGLGLTAIKRKKQS